MKIATIILALMLTTTAVNAETDKDRQFITELKQTDINFVYSSEGRLILMKTRETSDKVDAVLPNVPSSIKVKVIGYVNKGKDGIELTEEE